MKMSIHGLFLTGMSFLLSFLAHSADAFAADAFATDAFATDAFATEAEVDSAGEAAPSTKTFLDDLRLVCQPTLTIETQPKKKSIFDKAAPAFEKELVLDKRIIRIPAVDDVFEKTYPLRSRLSPYHVTWSVHGVAVSVTAVSNNPATLEIKAFSQLWQPEEKSKNSVDNSTRIALSADALSAGFSVKFLPIESVEYVSARPNYSLKVIEISCQSIDP